MEELSEQGLAAWEAKVQEEVALAKTMFPAIRALAANAMELPDVRTPDWPGYPARIAACMRREQALRLFDWRPSGQGDLGRVRHQEEYVEWRVVRNQDQVVIEVEMTSEFAAYWKVMAGDRPDQVRKLVSGFAGREVAPSELYGGQDPGDLDFETRQLLFEQTMHGGSPLNDGREAMCFMVHPQNSLHALVTLIISAAGPLVVKDEMTDRPRFPSGSEAMRGLGANAQDGRNSDPLLVERVCALVTSGQLVGFDDPVGVYIRGFQLDALEMPDGTDVPETWLTFSRGLSADEAADGRTRRQRLRIAAPEGSPSQLGDLRVRRTGEPVRFGGQLAALVEQVAYLRSGPDPEAKEVPVSNLPEARALSCTDETTSLDQMESAV